MRIAARRGSRLHAPESSLAALIAAYTGGANVLQLSFRLTADDHLVLTHDGDTHRLTGVSGEVERMTLAQLWQLDFSRTFQPRHSPGFRYFTDDNRRLRLETFAIAIEALPDDVELLIELCFAPTASDERRRRLVELAVRTIESSGIAERTLLFSEDPNMLRRVRTQSAQLRIATCNLEMSAEAQMSVRRDLGADGIIASLDKVLVNGELTPFGRALEAEHAAGKMALGVVLSPERHSPAFTPSEWRAMQSHPFIWAVLTDSLMDVAFARRAYVLVDEAFAGSNFDQTRFALGYAKANGYCEVTQRDGIHIRIAPYPEIPPPPADPVERRLQRIEHELINVARDWPYYSGGGVGFVPGVRGDFSAEVDYTVDVVAQATTLEMAVLNVDPGAHRGRPPASFRDKDSFYDPHGAPPYVGVEHDEDDGYRINWNLGSEYDSNQYGRPVGDGKSPRAARLRLERRGAYFAAYYRNDIDARDWVCCGVTRNHSLNPVVYLRCVAKRWRQESEANPNEYVPIVANHCVFRNLLIERYL